MFRNPTVLCALSLSASLSLSADFSYSRDQKVTGGSMAAMAGAGMNKTGKSSFKGQKMVDVNGDTTTIIDFGAGTITILNAAQKTYKVQKFGDMNGAGGNTDMTIDVKDTGQTKAINGFNAKQSVVTVNMDIETGRGPAMKMQAEIEVWRSTDVPGAAEMRAFYQKNGTMFPYGAMMGAGGNQSMQKAIAQVQKKLAESDGMVVEEVVRVKPAGGSQATMPQMPQMTPEQQAKMQAAMAQMQAMAKQGGPQAAAMQQAMAAMGRGAGAPASAGSSPSMLEMTIDNTGFSTAAVPDSVFVIPSDYKQVP